MIFFATIFVAFLSALWDSATIRRKRTLNHYLHAGVRAAVYVLLAFGMGISPLMIAAGWFLVTPAHRLLLNGMMGWSMFYIGSTSWYDKILHWVAEKLSIDEIGQFVTVFEVFIFACIAIFAI